MALLLAAVLGGVPTIACEWRPSAPVTVTPLSLPSARNGPDTGELVLSQAFRLRSQDPDFGGFSALELVGGDLFALSDRGTLWRLPSALLRGKSPATAPWWRCRLRTGDGAPDAESLAADGRGGLLVAVEGNHALHRLDPEASGAAVLAPFPLPGWLRKAPVNSGIEAATGLTDGRLLLLTEGLYAAPGLLRGALIEGDRALPLHYPVEDGFLPVGADALGEEIYLLERRFSLFGGFAARLRLLVLAARPKVGTVLAPRPLLRLEAPLPIDNFEGLAVRPAASGDREIYLVSDDNFSPLQATLLLRLEHRPGRRADID